jgi:hypothetical protein
MKLVWKTFSICKDGNREDENEDAVYPQLLNGTSLNVDQFSCAMADGATTSSFSKLWATLLVKESSTSHNLQQDFAQTLNSARTIWKNELSQKDLSWPAAIKVRQGSFATLLWFHIWHKKGLFLSANGTAERSWTAKAVGDTCLFHVGKGRFLERFPLEKSTQFSNTPDLISTNLSYQNSRITNHSISGTWQKGDHFIIASDALAAWIVSGLDSNLLGWATISENLTSLVRYQSWIRALRRQSLIKNDDTSLISLSVDE